jgi:type II secretory ATPase GspE/PulE/Tfp pilus assembly ATPase PilB-like protein
LEHLSQRERDLEKYLDQLEERELVYKERSVPELEYTFRHALTQEATYQGILERRRKEFHRRIADGIENLYRERIKEFYEELAHHYRLGGNDEKALEYLLKSGIKSVGRTLAQLGLEPEKYKAFYDVFHQMSGLTLVVGPIGSGKTTTLTAALDEINTPGVKLLGAFAVEDEIITDAIRASFNVDIGHTPAKMLRTVMLYDPDVIFVSDLPDKETVDIAIEAALMGHLVLSTLQAEDATDSLTHLLSIGVEPSRLANAIGAILAQRLVRKLCPQCKKALEPSEELRRTFAECQIEVPDKVYSAVGCDACEDGYKGRTAIHQVLVPNAEVRELIAQQASIEEIRSAARKGGMKTFLEDGMAKVALGIISAEEVFASLSGYFVNRHQVVSNNLVGRQ